MGYQTRSGLFKHKKALHYEHSGTLHCQEPNCHFTTQRLIQLREHLTNTHNIEMKLKTMTFADNEGIMLSMYQLRG